MGFIRTLPGAALLLALVLFPVAPAVTLGQEKAVPGFPDTEAAKHVGEEVAITGKVFAVSKSGKGTTYLNFGDRFPRHIFSGTVLARDEAKVGDVKIYEGKVVTITGKIEQAQDQKPQILISSPTQIKLADGGGAPAVATNPPPAPVTPPSAAPPTAAPAIPKPPMPAPVTPTAPAPPATTAALTPPSTPKPAEVKKMVLGVTWNNPGQGGEMTRKDLAMIFGNEGYASENVEGDPTVMLYGEVPFLAPLALAKKRLQLEAVTPSISRVSTPGLPGASFSSYGYTGIFAGGFNRLNIITDLADQVVSIQLVDENPRQRTSDTTDTGGYHTYNFVNGRSKGTNDLVVKHQVVKEGAPRGVVVVESMLIDPTDGNPPPKKSSSSSSSSRSTTRTGKVMEKSRWYVPGTVVSLILRCVGSR
jgi:hypothetical protein